MGKTFQWGRTNTDNTVTGQMSGVKINRNVGPRVKGVSAGKGVQMSVKSYGTPMKFSTAQITAIKNSPKGVLPKFIQGGIYKDKNVTSVGGKVGNVGGTIGYDRKAGKPFGSVNYKGKIKGKFGPQK